MIVLQTQRLILRQLTVDDGQFMLALLNDPAWLQYIGDRGVRTLEQAQDYLRNGAIDMYARIGFGLWMVELGDSREPIGLCGLIKRDTLPDVDLGFAFVEGYRRGGYAFEAATGTIRYAREQLGMQRVIAICSPENARSIRLLEKLGFHYEKSLRLPPNEARETHLYANTP